MKRLHYIFLIFFLVLGQWGSLDHDHYDHEASEICDYCLNAQSLDHAVATSTQPVIPTGDTQCSDEPAVELIDKYTIHYYVARAPPRLSKS
jgi:hypothetical protein